MKKMTILAALLASTAAHGAAIEQVIVRQQWPWSTDVKIEYRLSGVTSPVDISVKAYNGTVPLDNSNINSALRGTRYGITESGVGTIILDPVKAFGGQKVAIADFRVELELSDSAANVSEVIYKILDLENHTVTDVTRAELLSGNYGSVVTDFASLGPGWNTSLDDVLIWTGVTNDVAYKTTKMVFRKIPAAGKTYMMGQNNLDVNGGAGIATTISHDFWIGVFEVTQSQHEYFKYNAAYQAWETNALYAAQRVMDAVTYDSVHSYGEDGLGTWPAGTIAGAWRDRYFGKFRAAFSAYDELKYLGLPTEAQWEYACRAGTTNALYSGKPADNSNCAEVGRFRYVNIDNDGEVDSSDRNCDLSKGIGLPGQYLPNAYGLYDMLGNASEMCLDGKGSVLAGGIDPKGDTPPRSSARIIRGGCTRWSGPLYGTCHNREFSFAVAFPDKSAVEHFKLLRLGVIRVNARHRQARVAAGSRTRRAGFFDKFNLVWKSLFIFGYHFVGYEVAFRRAFPHKHFYSYVRVGVLVVAVLLRQ